MVALLISREKLKTTGSNGESLWTARVNVLMKSALKNITEEDNEEGREEEENYLQNRLC